MAAISSFSNNSVTPLIEHTVDGSLDHRGQPARRASSGGWRSASFIIVVVVAEMSAYYGITGNLIMYMMGPLGQSTATAAENVNTFTGSCMLLPILGAIVADSYLGCYRTIFVSSLLYILGLGLLTVSAALTYSDCQNTKSTGSSSSSSSCDPPQIQLIFFFFSLYLVAIAQAGHKACLQAFGANQFDGRHPKENKERSSFFNWYYFCLSAGIVLTLIVLVYIQDNLNWTIGFGIPCALMIAALLVLLLGSTTYRYDVRKNDGNPFSRIFQVIVGATRNWHMTPEMAGPEEVHLYNQCSKQFKFLNKALLAPNYSTVTDVEETKALLRLVPIWTTCLVNAIDIAQTSTFFTKQGAAMDRRILPGFEIPPASLQCFIGVGILLSIPIYDRVFVPIARSFTGKPAGITTLQRTGTGLVLTILCMVISALVEMKRLETAEKYGIVDQPNATVPMSVWWLVPQYAISGVSNVFCLIALQEFFYDQVPVDLRSMGLALYLSVAGVGSFLSSLLISVVDKATDANGQESWFANNINRAHLDYFYWLLTVLSTLSFIAFLYFSRSYIYFNQSKSDLISP